MAVAYKKKSCKDLKLTRALFVYSNLFCFLFFHMKLKIKIINFRVKIEWILIFFIFLLEDPSLIPVNNGLLFYE